MFVTAKLLEVPHAFSTREGGVSHGPFASLNLGHSVGDEAGHVAENARRFAACLGLTAGQLASANQVHGDRVIEIFGAADAGDLMPAPAGEADGLMTKARGVAACVRTADCVPILVHAPDVGAVAAIHAGWRGTVAGIAGKAVGALAEKYGAEPRNIVAAVGPHIRACCYEVSDEVALQFVARFGERITRKIDGRLGTNGGDHGIDYVGATGRSPFPGAWMLDLAEANRRCLEEAGVGRERIEILEECTCCDAGRFFSHRRDRGRTGRQLSAIRLL